MIWNWQQKDWPHFTYKSHELESLEKQFLQASGIFIGALHYLKEDEKQQFKIDLISNEALKTSEIEGEYLNRDSLQFSIRRHFGLDTAFKHKVSPAEQGISEMMVDMYQFFNKRLTHKTLFKWHEMLCKGRKDLYSVGKYRAHNEPMQVISGPLHKPIIHFEAPPSADVKKEMDGFIRWFNSSRGLPPLTRASIAHLYFVSIHPFEDGNGRIGRALAEKSLAESLGHPTLIALSDTIYAHKKSYYDRLEHANKHNNIIKWCVWFSEILIEAQAFTQKRVEFLITKTQFFDKFRGQLNQRQEKVIIRLFKEGVNGFKGGLSADKYITIAKTSSATASRDLKDLVMKKALTKTGKLKYTRYLLNI